jgi:hypothetical protein
MTSNVESNPIPLGARSQLIAQWLSRIFHPFTISPTIFWLVLYLKGASALESLGWTVVSLLIVIAPLLAAVIYNVRRGRFTDMDVSVREHRYGLYVLAIACFAPLIAILTLSGAPRIAIGCLYAAAFAIFVGATINRALTKISLHSVTMAGCTAILFFVSPTAGLLFSPITLLVGWARIHLNRHTAGQVSLGWLVAVVCIAIVLPGFSG